MLLLDGVLVLAPSTLVWVCSHLERAFHNSYDFVAQAKGYVFRSTIIWVILITLTDEPRMGNDFRALRPIFSFFSMMSIHRFVSNHTLLNIVVCLRCVIDRACFNLALHICIPTTFVD